MGDQDTKPRASDDLETAERKSKTVDERVPTHLGTDVVPEIQLPGAIGANIAQGGIGRGGPLGADGPGPGEVVLEHEAKGQRSQPSRS